MSTSTQDLYNLLQKYKVCGQDRYKPIIFDITKNDDRAQVATLLESSKNEVIFHDELDSQVQELYKIRHPQERLTELELADYYRDWAAGQDIESYGLYIYYPWNRRLVHTVGREEFIELRTSRNRFKITAEEQETLAAKTVGVIGLSVGQSVALTMAMERLFGRIRLADFDTLELTNLNRIRTGIHNLGLSKTVAVAREIAEIDPFLEVELFSEGITDENLGQFLGTGDDALDVLVEECDSLEVKIAARQEARKRHIPVVMDTSDRGMIDIERFDLEPNRPLLHGKVEEEKLVDISSISNTERMNLTMSMVDFDNLSHRLRDSIAEIGVSINTWPQLASEVVKGGGISATVIRLLLLGSNECRSGRYYFDSELDKNNS